MESGTPSAPKVLTIGQVAKASGVAPRTAKKWFDSGLLKGFTIPGGLDRRVYADDLVRFLVAHQMRVPEGLIPPDDSRAPVRDDSADA